MEIHSPLATQLPPWPGGGLTPTTAPQDDEVAQGVKPEQAQTPPEQRQEEQRERDEIRRLQQREQEVIAHENAHRAAGGGLVRGGGYEYVTGPDGRRYIAGGDVQIDTSPVPGDPEATIAKGEQVIRAALAPVDPSPQDLRVAADAKMMVNQARVEAQLERYREQAEAEDPQPPGQLLDLVA